MAARDLTVSPLTSIARGSGIAVIRLSDRWSFLRLGGDTGRIRTTGNRSSPPGNVFKVSCVKTTDVNRPIGPASSSDGSGRISKFSFGNQTIDSSLEPSGMANGRRKTKIVCTIGPSSSTREMIWKLAEEGMNIARLNMSHGDHASHKKTIDLVREYNAQSKDNVIAIMLDTKDFVGASQPVLCR